MTHYAERINDSIARFKKRLFFSYEILMGKIGTKVGGIIFAMVFLSTFFLFLTDAVSLPLRIMFYYILMSMIILLGLGMLIKNKRF
jgi:hypothetical protein